MTKEELEELKSVNQSVIAGERSPDELYELLDIHIKEIIQTLEDKFDRVKNTQQKRS